VHVQREHEQLAVAVRETAVRNDAEVLEDARVARREAPRDLAGRAVDLEDVVVVGRDVELSAERHGVRLLADLDARVDLAEVDRVGAAELRDVRRLPDGRYDIGADELAAILEIDTDVADHVQNELSELELELAMLDADAVRDERHLRMSAHVAELRRGYEEALQTLTDAVLSRRATAPEEAEPLYGELEVLFARYRSR